LGLLAVVSVLGGIVLVASAGVANQANEALTSGAPQQAVVAGWHTNDLLQVVVFELVVLVVAVVSVVFAVVRTEETQPLIPEKPHAERDMG
jgi:preprotein translocase subunit SecY